MQLHFLWELFDPKTSPSANRLDPKTVKGIIERFESGDRLELNGRRGLRNDHRQFDTQTMDVLLQIVLQDETMMQDEMLAELEVRTGKTFSQSGVSRALKELGWTRKQDERNGFRRYGYAPEGERTHTKTGTTHADRHSVLGAISQQGLISALTVKGAFNGADMLHFYEQCLAPILQLFPGPHSVVVADNATIHKDPEFKAAITGHQAMLVFIPSYSPDLNPIEHTWGYMKAWHRREEQLVQELGVERAIQEGLDQVTEEDCKNWIAHDYAGILEF
ncbi:hypothetical protein WJX73_002118 [Symbiochloris irregularis]|uniref:Tc1-like transposase DDE domain-containing protein n=1 Tax=Symbiochloris irregularis TaxID=706552 RepID=A0AAW1PMP0_9CHLO